MTNFGRRRRRRLSRRTLRRACEPWALTPRLFRVEEPLPRHACLWRFLSRSRHHSERPSSSVG